MRNYEYKIQIRYTDFDTQNLINHTKICTYIENTYVTFVLNEIKKDWTMDKFPLVLRKEITDFFIPIESKSDVICKLKVTHIGKTSFTMCIELFEKGTAKVFAKGERVMVYVNFISKRPVNLEQDFIEKLSQFMI